MFLLVVMYKIISKIIEARDAKSYEYKIGYPSCKWFHYITTGPQMQPGRISLVA